MKPKLEPVLMSVLLACHVITAGAVAVSGSVSDQNGYWSASKIASENERTRSRLLAGEAYKRNYERALDALVDERRVPAATAQQGFLHATSIYDLWQD